MKNKLSGLKKTKKEIRVYEYGEEYRDSDGVTPPKEIKQSKFKNGGMKKLKLSRVMSYTEMVNLINKK